MPGPCSNAAAAQPKDLDNEPDPLTRLTAARPLELGRPFAILAARLKVWAATRAEALAARRRFSREMQQLQRFTAGELRDVGLSRADFAAIAAGTFRRD